MNKTTLYLPDELRTSLKQIAIQTGRPEAAVIREALAAYVAQHARPRPRTIGMAVGGTVNATEIEDWLEKNWKPDW